MFLVVAVSLLIFGYCPAIATAESGCPKTPDSLPDLITLGVPDRCVDGTDGSKCDMFLRMAPNKENKSFVDFYLEGNLPGWVAVGFSLDNKMVLTDVVGCKQDSSGKLGAVNTWNPKVVLVHNEIDPSQDLMCNYGLKYEDDRFKCHFGRYSGIINRGYDYNLNSTYRIILGHSSLKSEVDKAFPIHTVFPTVLDGEYNVYNYTKKGCVH